MDNRKLPAILAAVGVVVAVALFFVLKDDTADQPTERTTSAETSSPSGADDEASKGESKSSGSGEEPADDVPVIQIENGEPVGGVKEFDVTKGEDIRFVVESDEAYEIHMHTYDVAQDVPAGGKTEFDVPATIEGIIEVEIEDTAVPIASISVLPS